MSQDGATPHTTNSVLNWLKSKFGIRVISRFADRQNRGGVNWPSRSPDLSPLDYWYWSHIQKLMKDRCLEEGRRPDTIVEIKNMVEELSETLSENDIRRAVANIRKRAQKCLEEGDRPGPNDTQIPCPGGHFQHRM